MEQLRHIGEVLGSLRVLMAFQDEIRINKRQCCLLVDAFNLAFEVITEEMRQNLNFDERVTKWKALEHPLKELHRILREGEQYVRQCMGTKDWWVKAISLRPNTDCVEFHLHNLLGCVPVVLEAIEACGEVSGCDQDDIHKKRLVVSKKYEREWADPKLFQHKFGRQYLVSRAMCGRMDTAWKEDRWALLDMVSEKRSSLTTKQESRLAELLEGSRGRIFPSSILVGSKDYHVRRRLGSGSHYKEIQWMGESFAVRHFFGNTEPLVPEISLLSSLAHPNVMTFLCAFSDEEKKECFLLMELMHKSLCNHIKEVSGPKKRVPFPLPVAVDVMLQIARGMEYLHSRGICHGNLNPSTILVKTRSPAPDGPLFIKIADIGLPSVKNSRSSPNQTATDPRIWFAPEVLLEREQAGGSCESKHTEKADVYSFGMVCFELLTGKVPFEDGHLQGEQMSRNIRAGERPLFPFPSPKYLTSLTKWCWQTDPSQRPNFSSICRMLRYIKRFLLLNPDYGQPDPPVPPADYFDLEASLSRRFTTWATTEPTSASQVPFQMFAYSVAEREKICVNIKEKSSESESERASVCGDENALSSNTSEDACSVSVSPLKPSPPSTSEVNKKRPLKKAVDGRTNVESGRKHRGAAARPPQVTTPCGRSLRMNSEGRLPPMIMSPGRRRSGHTSD